MPLPSVVAHRGYSAVAPENTLPALAAAVHAGADWIEFDVRTTLDGVPVVFHDRTVDRTTDGTGSVWELTIDQVDRLDAGSWFSQAFAGVHVPHLDEVLDLLVAAGPQLLMEIKPPATVDQVKVMMAQVAERGLLERTVVQSFDPGILHLVAEVAPEVRRGLLRLSLDADPVGTAFGVGAILYNPSVADVLGDPEAMARLQAAGVDIMSWTANDPDLWPALSDLGLAGIITDRAGELVGWSAARD